MAPAQASSGGIRFRGLRDAMSSYTSCSLTPEIDTLRYPTLWNLDLRLAKDLRLMGGVGITVSLDAFNVFNSQTILQRNTRLGIASPRTIALPNQSYVDGVVGESLRNLEGVLAQLGRGAAGRERFAVDLDRAADDEWGGAVRLGPARGMDT